MKIEIKKVLWMIQQSEYLETDERHTEEYRVGVKTAHKSLKIQLEDYEERMERINYQERGEKA